MSSFKEIKVNKLVTFLEKTKGLALNSGRKSVYFETRYGIHTFFVRYSIDVCLMSDDWKVIRLWTGIRPGRIIIWNPLYRKVIESPSSMKSFRNWKKGDKVKISNYP